MPYNIGVAKLSRTWCSTSLWSDLPGATPLGSHRVRAKWSRKQTHSTHSQKYDKKWRSCLRCYTNPTSSPSTTCLRMPIMCTSWWSSAMVASCWKISTVPAVPNCQPCTEVAVVSVLGGGSNKHHVLNHECHPDVSVGGCCTPRS